MNKVIGIILIIGALALGYLGYNTLNESQASVEIGELEISAGDQSEKSKGYVYLGLAVACLIAGGYILTRGKKVINN